MTRKYKPLPSVEELSHWFSYDPITGDLVWLRNRGRGRAGVRVGARNLSGYLITCLGGEWHYIHRIIWKMVYGEDPSGEIDHANLDTTDNRLENLRMATRAQQTQNQSKTSRNTSGYKGVSFRANRGTWLAQIQVNGVYKYLGSYATAEQAKEAYDAAAEHYFGEYARSA